MKTLWLKFSVDGEEQLPSLLVTMSEGDLSLLQGFIKKAKHYPPELIKLEELT